MTHHAKIIRVVKHGGDVQQAIRSVFSDISEAIGSPDKTRLVIDGTGYNTVIRAIAWSNL